MFVSKHVYVVNLDPAVMTLTFRASIDIHDTVRYNRTRDRSSGRAAAVASTPGSRVQAATEGGILGLRHKTMQADGGRRRHVVEARASVSGLTKATGVDGI